MHNLKARLAAAHKAWEVDKAAARARVRMENLLEIFVSKKNKPTLSESIKYFCNIKKDDQQTTAQSTNIKEIELTAALLCLHGAQASVLYHLPLLYS